MIFGMRSQRANGGDVGLCPYPVVTGLSAVGMLVCRGSIKNQDYSWGCNCMHTQTIDSRVHTYVSRRRFGLILQDFSEWRFAWKDFIQTLVNGQE